MQREEVLTWDEIGKAGIIAAVVATVGALFAYFRSISNKVDKSEYAAQLTAIRSDFARQIAEMQADFEKNVEALNRRHSAWETRSERFVTRELFDTLYAQIQKMEERQVAGFEKLNNRLDKLIEARR